MSNYKAKASVCVATMATVFGIRTGYFHLSESLCEEGDVLKAGGSVGIVGAGPKSSRHLHFEVSPVGRYRPMDPEAWLKSEGAVMV